MGNAALAALVPVAEVKVAQEGIVKEALKNDILVARRPCVVDAAKTARAARGNGCVG